MLECERHLTLVTPVGAVRRVEQHVCVEAMLAGESLAAVRANVGPLT